MIQLQRKEDCVGCRACEQRCPKHCITVGEDNQGFLYPTVNLTDCIDCHLCEKVCPVINQGGGRTLRAYAVKNPDLQIRDASSSGGVFYVLAKQVIDEGGVVFGVRFSDRWEVEHGYAETLDGVREFMTSKYVQSNTGRSFSLVESFLKQGRRVLFSGTPCQIAGLKGFLMRDYGKQLLCVDVACHGCPSPLVWRDYLEYITRPTGESVGKNTVFQTLKERPVITGISFRDKRNGWEKFGFSIRYVATEGSDKNSVFQSVEAKEGEFYEPFWQNLFMQGFLKDVILRPSCFECPAKNGKSGADITLADFWGIKSILPTFYDKSGVSLVLASEELPSLEGVIAHEVKSKDVIPLNPAIARSAKRPPSVDELWSRYPKEGFSALQNIVDTMSYVPLCRRVINKVKYVICRILGRI